MRSSEKKQVEESKKAASNGAVVSDINGVPSVPDSAREDISNATSESEDEDWHNSSSDNDGDSSSISDNTDESSDEDDEDTKAINEAMLDYMGALEERRQREALGSEEEEPRSARTEVESDSSEDEVPSRNTIGNVPLHWYKDEQHIGYDLAGKKIKKKEKQDQIDSFLAHTDGSKSWRRKIYDEYNDEEVELTKEEVDMIRRIRAGRIPHAEVNAYEPYVDWFDWDGKGHPLSNAPEPKRRFIPSKWEAKKVVKLVRAIRNGWIKLDKPKEKPKFYLLWGDDLKATEKTANGLTYIPPPKPKLPGHEESYNPPVEYIPTQEEINSYALMYEEDRPKFIPQGFQSLRQVPAYSEFIKERFERCLDLYLCPRSRKKRIDIDPESLIPKLPKPKDLQPFPNICYLEYHGHTGPVVSIAVDPSGMWLASGSMDQTVRLWEVQTARCCRVWSLDGPVRHIAWNPRKDLGILAISLQSKVLLLDLELGTSDPDEVSKLLALNPSVMDNDGDGALVTWMKHENLKALEVKHSQEVLSITWHHKGDYFTSVAPDANTRAVLVHQLSKQQTQNPFRKLQGRVVTAMFHPSRPFLFVATKMHVRVYNLVKQQLSKKLMTGLHEITSMAIHSKGDNLIVGSKEGKICWFDMDLSTQPYKTIKNHHEDIQAVAFHTAYPLFASCADDSTVHVFHGMVYNDLLQNPLIVPLKILHGHSKTGGRGILDCCFHSNQPWLFSAGADSVIKLFCD
ncbi:hypothetical protein KP509_28G059200 [Ceratopteris richardii]|uniref:Ribosome biogenesis protein BOP1 homolog n=1 Tax=Ceratopteris richardii TaxID=49495 RepID=A0A8T2RCP9_CERRI|nr:hypothetical protein KP509_28G059200 [Ceratopteris richardii]